MRTARLTVGAVAAAGVCLLLSAGPAWAHHAFAAEFDANLPIRLHGTVAKVEWINPHSWIHVDVKNDDGEVERWMIEGGNPTALLRRGSTGNPCRLAPRSSSRDLGRKATHSAPMDETSRFRTAPRCSWGLRARVLQATAATQPNGSWQDIDSRRMPA